MAESNSSHNNPDHRGRRKFRYGESARDDAEYPLSRREEDMSPEEVEAYLAKQIVLEEQQSGEGRSTTRSQSSYGPGGKKIITRTTTTYSKPSRAGSGGEVDETDDSGQEGSSRKIRRRPDQDFPELRTLRRWSLVSRWWMRSLGEGFYRFITLDWNLEEGAAALANWRPTQQTLWRFSTLTGVASILLTLLLFWHYRGRPGAAPELNSLVSTDVGGEVPDFSEEDTIEPTPPLSVVRVKESEPDFSDFEKNETQLAMNDVRSPFEDEPIIEPKAPVSSPPRIEEPRLVEPEPMETDFAPPIKVPDDNEFEAPRGAKAKASASTIVESDVPPPKKESNFNDEDWDFNRRQSEDPAPVVQKYKSVPIDDFHPEPARPDPEPEVTRIQDEKPMERVVPDPVPDLPDEEPVVRREPPPAVREPVAPPPPAPRQRVAISRSGRWANDQQGAAIYSMTIRNLDSQELGELEIVESLPEGAKFISASGRGEYDGRSHSVRWLISGLNGNGSFDLSVQVQPKIVPPATVERPRRPQTSSVQVSDRRGVVESRSWKVDHTPCLPGAETYQRTAEVVPVGYYQELSDGDYFFGW